jgi:hypothetical protein
LIALLWLLPLAVVAAVAGVWVWALTFGPFKAADLNETLAPARPALNAVSVAAWREQRAEILSALAEHVYGPEPARIEPVVSKREAISNDYGGIEQWRVEVAPAGYFNMVLILPQADGPSPAPVILMQNFLGNQAAFEGRPSAIAPPHLYAPPETRHPALDPLLRLLFGKYMAGAPFDVLSEHGYALALVYGGDIVPDHPREARAALAKFAPAETGALSGWAWVYSRMLDALSADARLDPTRMTAWGQSRQGKAALLAGARDERFVAVVALQPGRGGDALTQHRSGETVAGITRMFPHWFTPRFASYAATDPPVDQHQLLAAIAPRALLLGRVHNDAWADPLGGHAAVLGARPIYDVYGAEHPREYGRRGRHGIYLQDWIETLRFLDARLKPVRAPAALPE